MIILAIDTSALTASAAVSKDGKILAEKSSATALTHSQTLMPMIDDVLKTADISIADVELFAVSNGPGSFTGLRIGIGTIKGLAYGLGKKTVGVCTLDALAHNVAFSPYLIAPIMDARRGQVYNALYRSVNGKIERIAEPEALSVEELASQIKEKVLFVGDGVEVYKKELSNLLGSKALFAPMHMCLQRGASVAAAATQAEPVDSAQLGAIYLRKSQAEREREEKLKNI